MTLTDTDGALPVARRRLDDAVARLADPRPQWLDGVLRCEAALYERLRGALNGAVVARRQVHTSRVPCRVDVLTLLVSVDTTVGGWEPHREGHGRSAAAAGRSGLAADGLRVDGRLQRPA